MYLKDRISKSLLALILILHCAALAYKLESSRDKSGKKGGSKPSKENPEERSRSTSNIRIIQKPQTGDSSKSDGVGIRVINAECKTWFYGVGITHSTFTNEVTQVTEGYPAHRAGILVGDIILHILNETGEDIKYTNPAPKDSYYEGKHITLVVLRKGSRMSFKLRREKICTDESGHLPIDTSTP